MPKLTQDMKQMLKRQPVVVVATIGDQRLPNVSLKGVLKVADDDKLVFSGLFSTRTEANRRANPNVAVVAVDPQTYEGYQFKGWADSRETLV